MSDLSAPSAPSAWRRVARWAAPALAALLVVLAVNTLRLQSRQPAAPALPLLPIDVPAAAERLGGAIRIPTISHDRSPASAEVFRELHAYLQAQYPKAHQVMKREVVNGASLLYSWQGDDAGELPILLMAHQDVVPVEPGTETKWSHPPFAGVVAEDHVWGRGAWDDKGNLLAMMEAVELLAGSGFRPRRTVYFAFGHDEETGTAGGQEGAKRIAALLAARGVRLAFVLDEGLLVAHDAMKGLEAPVALVGVAEKGYLTLDVSTEGASGHSSMPPARTAIGALATARGRIEHHPMPARLHAVVREMIETLAPEFSGANRLVLSNLWLFEPFVRRQMEASPSAGAMLRTTTALTVVKAGEKESSLPSSAAAQVNFRLLPGDLREEVIRQTDRAVDDASVAVEPAGLSWEASPVSRTDSAAFATIRRTIREVFPDAVVAPGLMVGFTDSHHFLEIADDVYRFTPVRARQGDLPRFHGTDERISLANYAEMIRFYHRLLTATSARDA
jgi:carboxypeptidase PM20D1